MTPDRHDRWEATAVAPAPNSQLARCDARPYHSAMEQEEMRERERGIQRILQSVSLLYFLCVSCVLERPSERASNERVHLFGSLNLNR